jgi:methionyl-tRNA formyltransferase
MEQATNSNLAQNNENASYQAFLSQHRAEVQANTKARLFSGDSEPFYTKALATLTNDDQSFSVLKASVSNATGLDHASSWTILTDLVAAGMAEMELTNFERSGSVITKNHKYSFRLKPQ